jgi:SAM-dependent methyltransferase
MADIRRAGRHTEEELQAIYDQSYVDQYDPHAVQRMRRLLPFIDLSGGEVVADFGCGNGVLLDLIGPRVREYVGIDFSEAFVRAAERRRDARGTATRRFMHGIVAFCARHPNRFDAAFALDFSEHLRRPVSARLSGHPRVAQARRGALSAYAECRILPERLKERGILTQVEGPSASGTPAATNCCSRGAASQNVRFATSPH